MSENCVIQWKSKINGRAGKGSKVFSRQEAEQLVAELNQEYPEIQHELITAPANEPETPPGSDQSRQLAPEGKDEQETSPTDAFDASVQMHP
jgi:hypothetical protein